MPQIQPPSADVNALIALYNGRRYAELESRALLLIKQYPDFGFGWKLLGGALQMQGKNALPTFQKVAELTPGDAEAHYNLGVVLKGSGRLDAAAASYRRAVKLKPDYAEAHSNLGNVLKDLGQLDDAVACYRRATEINPAFAMAHSKLGATLRELGQFEGALESYRRALELEPDHVTALNNYASALKNFGRLENILATYRRVVELKPDSAEAHNNLGSTLKKLGQLDAASASYRRALELKPEYTAALMNWGSTLREQGYFEDARDYYRKAQALGFKGAQVIKALMLPNILGTQQEILESRAEFERNLDQLIAEQLKLEDPLGSSIETNFYMSYHGLDDRDLQIKVAKFYEQACPSLLYASAHCAKPKPVTRKKIRVGFISGFFAHHPVSSCFSKIIETISSREQFDVLLLSERPIDKMVYSEFAGRCVHLPYSLYRAREVIAGLELDVLIYLDVGMEPFSYFLAFSRLARAQCVLGGHPVTTGIKNIDYFLSTELTEPANADEHYSEKLVRFKKATSYFARPSIPTTLKSRRELGLPEGRRLYMCPTKLQKMHPDFDEAMAQILTIDNEGLIVLFEDGMYPVWKENLVKRFEMTIPEAVRERVIFLPWLRNKTDFFSALTEADVILDPFHFGSGSTLSFIFATGTPLVTKPGEFMRGRIGMGQCMAMGLTECIAEDTAAYAEKAVAIATDRSLRDRISAKILKNNSVYYENLQAVEELSDFICSLQESWHVSNVPA